MPFYINNILRGRPLTTHCTLTIAFWKGQNSIWNGDPHLSIFCSFFLCYFSASQYFKSPNYLLFPCRELANRGRRSWTGSRPSCSPWNELVMEGSKTKAIMLQALAASCRWSPDTYLFRSDSARFRLLCAFHRGGRSWKLSGMQLKAKWKTHTQKRNRLAFPCANGSSEISPLLYRSAVHHLCSVQPPEQCGRAAVLL